MSADPCDHRPYNGAVVCELCLCECGHSTIYSRTHVCPVIRKVPTMHPQISTLIREDDIKGDPWGTALSHHFAIAGTLWAMGEDIPASWQYRPTAIRQSDMEEALIAEGGTDWAYLALMDAGAIHVSDLVHAGNVLSRYVKICEAAGADY